MTEFEQCKLKEAEALMTNESCIKNEKKAVQVSHDLPPAPPDGGWGWFCVLSCSLAHFLIEGSEKSYGLVFLVLRDQYGTSSSVIAFIPSLVAGLRLFLGPLGSALGTKFSSRKVVIAGGCLFLVSFVSSVQPPNLYFLYFSYGLLSGLAGALTQGNCIIMVGRYFRKNMSLANGIGMAGGGMGIFILPILVQFLLDQYGYFGYMLICGGLLFNVVICGALLRPLDEGKEEGRRSNGCRINCCCQGNKNDDKDNVGNNMPSLFDMYAFYNSNESICFAARSMQLAQKEQSTETKQDSKNRVQNHPKTKLMHWSLLKEPTFILTAFCILFTLMGNLLGFIFLPALAEEKQIASSQRAFLVSIVGISDVVGRLSIGAVSDIKCIRPYRRHIFMSACFLFGLVVEMMPLATEFSHFVALCISYGLFEGMVISQRNVMLADLLGYEKYASCIGLAHMFGGVGFLTGPFLGGAIQDVFGKFTYSFAFAGCMIWIGALCFLAEFIWFEYCRKKPQPIMFEADIA